MKRVLTSMAIDPEATTLAWYRRKAARTTLAATGAIAATMIGVALALADPTALASGRRGAGERSSSVDIAYGLAVGRDGKLVVVGLSRKGGRYTWALARYGVSGALDRSFGGGRVLTEFGSTSVVGAYAVATQADGKIVAAGGGEVAQSRTGFALARYGVNGKLDRTFGRNGRVLNPFPTVPGDVLSVTAASAIAVQTDGKLVVAGGRGGVRFRDFALARYTRRGELDPSFGRGGKVVTDLGSSHQAGAAAVAVQADGKIVAAGTTLVRGRDEFAVARFTARGALDPSFGQGGRVLTAVGPWSEASGLAVQADGKLVVAGTTGIAEEEQFALIRYSADGKLDPTFGSGGKAVIDFDPERGEVLDALTTLPDGRLVAVGWVRGLDKHDASRFALARYTETGSLDASFGKGGKIVTDMSSSPRLEEHQSRARAVAIEPGGKIVAAGSTSGDFALARYTNSGSLDPSFGSRGKVATAFGSPWRTKIASLSATRIRSNVLVRWRSASQLDARGFNVYRERNRGRRRANRELILAKGSGGRGAAYSFLDRGVSSSIRRYRLEEVTIDGTRRWVGYTKLGR